MIVEYANKEGVASVELNRPACLNALNDELVGHIGEAVGRGIREGASVLILSGHGKAFCSGHDLRQELPSGKEPPERETIERIQDLTRLIRRAPFPVIALVQGYALGAGCELALCSDLIVASKEAVFGFPEVSVGLAVTGGISHILPLAVGLARAKELVLLGKHFSADTALTLGLINRVVEHEELVSAGQSMAEELARMPRGAITRAKRCLDHGPQVGLMSAMELETDFALASHNTDESRSAAIAFKERKELRS